MKNKIALILAALCAFAVASCSSTSSSSTAQTALAGDTLAGGISLFLANNPQYEPDLVAFDNLLSVNSTAPITLGQVAALLTQAKVNPLVTNAVAPLVVDTYALWVQQNPGGTVTQWQAVLKTAVDGGIQLYLAEHPQVAPKTS